MQKEEKANDVWKQIWYKSGVGDVMVLNYEGEIFCLCLSNDYARRRCQKEDLCS